jgi:hypothetical protein
MGGSWWLVVGAWGVGGESKVSVSVSVLVWNGIFTTGKVKLNTYDYL